MKRILLIFVMIGQFSLAQGFMYHGIVQEGGMPLPGAGIIIKGTNIGTESDFNGKYKIRVNVGTVLEIKYIGMEKTTITITRGDYERAMRNSIPINDLDKSHKIDVKTIENDDYKKAISKIDSIKPSEVSGYLDNGFYNITRMTFIKRGDLYQQKQLNEFSKLKINFSTTALIGKPIRLYQHQNSYAQGRSLNNILTYQAPETNEIFSWGSPINQLSIGNNTSEFYSNGTIESNLLGNKVPIYERNNLFSNTFQTTNNLGLLFHFNHNQSVHFKISNQRFYNTFSSLQNDFLDASINFKQRLRLHNFNIQIGYNRNKDYLNNDNFLVNKIIFSNAITPSHFNSNSATILSNGLQRNFTNAYNNPYFLLQNIQDTQNQNQFNFFVEDKFKKNYITNTLSIQANISKNEQQFGQSPQTINATNGNVNFRNENYVKNIIRNNLEWEKSKITLSSNTHMINEVRDFKRDFYSFSANSFPNNGNITQSINQKLNRFSVFQDVGFKYRNYNDFTLESKPSIIYTSTLKDKVAFNYYNSLEFRNLFWYVDIFLSHNFHNSEPSIQQNNLNFNTLNFKTSEVNNWNNNQELIVNPSFEPRKHHATSLVLSKNYYNYNFKIKLYYDNIKNEYAPINNNGLFMFQPAFDYTQKGIELNFGKNFRFNYEFNTSIDINFEKFKNNVTRTFQNNRIPFAGFQDVNKNYIEGQPLGIIIGSKYARNPNNEIIIGTDGFPLIAEGLHELGNPNPNFITSLTNEWKYKNWILSFNFQYQHGGTLWDGTQQTLNYFGVSQQTAEERNTINYVFQGVNANGQTNTTPVSFYNPQLPVTSNKWVRNGFAGVTEEAIVDASYLNINEMSFSYQSKLYENKIFPFDFKIQLFVNNIFLWSKSKTAMVNQQLFNGTETNQLNFFNAPMVQTYGISLTLKL